MPNLGNISKPLVLLSYGRSGTSLVQSAFQQRDDCFVCGETAGLITNTWNGVEFSQRDSLINTGNGALSPAQHCSRAVQALFLSLFASESPIWFQKIIGAPPEWLGRIETNGEFEAADWYWTVLTKTFPEGKFFTILRNPYDVVISAKAYWNLDEELIWDHLRITANLITHPKSRIDYAITFDGLRESFDDEMMRLCSHLDISPSADMTLAKEIRHVPSNLSESSEQFGYRRLWSELADGAHVDTALDAIERVWQRFGSQFEGRSHAFSAIAI